MRVFLSLSLLFWAAVATSRAETSFGKPVPAGDTTVVFSPAFASPMLGTLGSGANGLIATVERAGEADVAILVSARLESGTVETLEGSGRVSAKGYVWLPASARVAPDGILAVTVKVTVTYRVAP